jgi:hypothetical protein
MLVVLHVLTALSSLIYTGYVYFSPSKSKIYGAYAFIAATLLTGGVLTYASHVPLLSVCMTGLLYLGAAGAGILAAHRKLSRQSASE